ncbi:uncharacterized protein VICG_00570 [Vittaforma corneae ATCC 50505]|uniref:SLC41A/MgtE integral membrane domain-containing protein n=1 Tax=Vittaforma corneae (strain ATCC 50505) TaxID=993615 RepID=L2GNQ1_VITCO|nr:uncharacterized protein VICG_00570 [Vittaforma corneae ATCC 50505]ELA42471.1 hypothetical protein VICG_00570 [Vittaforma corneae ATCC 50505]
MFTLINSVFDISVISQSLLSISITLLGMLFTSSLFKAAVSHKSLQHFPFVLLSSTILGFKSNVELGYVMHLSTLRVPTTFTNFKRIVIANSCLIAVESFTVGVFSGLLGAFEIAFDKKSTVQLYSVIFLSSVLTCFLSTAAFILLFIFSLELAVYFSMDPENFLMPLLNVINDVLVVKFLFMFAKGLQKLSTADHLWILFLVTIATGVCFYFIFVSENLLPIQSIETVAFTFGLNIISGFILEKSSAMFSMIAPAFPVFTGMSTSIALICLHKTFTVVENQRVSIPSSTNNSLILISFFISITYVCIARAIYVGYSVEFSFCFIFMFIIQVILLLKIVEYMVLFIKNQGKNISSDTVPLISSISDFTGSLALVLVSILLSNK